MTRLELCTRCVHFLDALSPESPSQGFGTRRVPNQGCKRAEFTIALPIERDVSFSKDLAPTIADIAVVERNQLCNVTKILLGNLASVTRQNATSRRSEPKLGCTLAWPPDRNMYVNGLTILGNPEKQDVLPKRQYFRHQAIACPEARRSASSKINGLHQTTYEPATGIARNRSPCQRASLRQPRACHPREGRSRQSASHRQVARSSTSPEPAPSVSFPLVYP